METWGRLSASAAEPGSQIAGVSPERSSLLLVLSEIQTLVERSKIINRTPHIDLNWYLRFSPDEPEIRLARTAQRVLACRYQPAQLDLLAMGEQVREAEELQCCVQDQVGAMKRLMAARVCHPDSWKRLESQWGAALLDASATAHVKATQLEQVKGYHRQLEGIRAFLQDQRAQKDKTKLSALGSSALLSDRLWTQLQTLVNKRGMVEELLRLSSQLSVHLSHSESSGALLARLGDVQEEWRYLMGSIRRAFWHASNSTSQHAVIMKNIEEVKAELGARQELRVQRHHAFDELCLRAELKLYNQRCLRFQAQFHSLALFSFGQKEKEEISRALLDLKSSINVAESKLGASSQECPGALSAQTYRRLQEWIEWAKQAENHGALRQKLPLFPEEARVQMAEMRRFQSHFCSRRSKLRVETERMKGMCVENPELLRVLETTEGLYESVQQSLERSLDAMKKSLQEREKLFLCLADTDAWLAETLAKRDPYGPADSFSNVHISELESELKHHKSSTVDLENRLKLLEEVMDGWQACPELGPGESRYLVNRLSGLWAILDGLRAHEKASRWELEELIFRRRSSEEELSNVQTSLRQISVALTQDRFPLPQETVLTLEHLRHTLVERQWEVQELQHCQEARRSSLLCTIGKLQDRCKALSGTAFEQDKYLRLRKQMEESTAIAREQIQHIKASTVGVEERFRLCQTLLVEVPLAKTQCQEAADQLEAIAEDLSSSELQSERRAIIQKVETLVSWEHSLTEDIRNLEKQLLLGLHFSSELPAFIQFLEKVRSELRGAEPVKPDETVIDAKLQRCWVIWRNLECGVSVLEVLGQKEKIDMKSCKELRFLEDAAKHECQLRMESLSQARESLKDYHWAAQGAISFLHNAEATFLTAPGGFVDCREEQKQTQQALEALEDGFQAHISHLSERLPRLACLSRPETEELHINLLGQLTVGRAVLEAQAQIRLESLQRCEMRQQGHKKSHEDLGRLLSGLQTKLSECSAGNAASYEKCIAQQETAELLMEALQNASTRIEELRAGCPMQSCAVGKGGELSALWRRWLCLRRNLGLLTAGTQQRAEEWNDITASMKELCSCLHELQADVPDSSSVNAAMVDPQELLAQAEMHQAILEEQQQALASLKHRVERVLSSSAPQEPLSPGPVGETLVKIQESIQSLKEKNRLVLAAAQAEERLRQVGREDIGQLEQWVDASLPSAGNPLRHQELGKGLSSQEAKLEGLTEGAQKAYPDIPAEDVHLSMQTEEEMLLKKRDPVWMLDSQVAELESSLEKVKVLLEEQRPTVQEAQHLLKNVWDKLDAWHSRLMRLENAVQDAAEDHPDQAYILMDQLTRPLQLYQNAAQMAEQRTAFLGKIPTCLQEFEGVAYSAACWLDEAQSWLNAPCCFTTAKNLQNHANSLQLVLDDSERIRHVLQNFRPVLDEISTVCDMSFQEDKLEQSDRLVHEMQRTILEQLDHFLQAALAVEATEEELKTIESNVPELQAMFSGLNPHNQQTSAAILANVASIRRTLEEVESRKGELHLPRGADESLLIFPKAVLLLQTLQELEQLSEQQATRLKDLEEKPDSSSRQHKDADELLLRSEDKILDGRDLLTEMETRVNVSASVPNAARVETSSFGVVPEVHVKELLPEHQASECPITAGTPDLTFGGIQTLHLQATGRREEGEVHLSPSAGVCQDQVIDNVERTFQHEQQIDSKKKGSSMEAASLTGCEGDEEHLSWNQLYRQICQKMATLGQVKDERQAPFSSEDGGRCLQVPKWMPRSACVALRRAQESVAMLREIRRVDSLHPGLNEEMYRAARHVLLCLRELVDSGVSPCDGTKDDSQLRQLQQECLATEVLTLSELLTAVESDMVPGISGEHAEAECCVKSLRDCLDAVQQTSTPLCCQLSQQLDLPCEHQELKNLLHICDVFEPKQSGIFLNLMDTPILELILGRRVQECPGDEARLQQASRALLQGLSILLDQGEGCLTAGPGRVHSRGGAEAVLRRHQKFLQLLRSQVAFIQNLFQREPKVLVSLEAEWTRLGVRVRCLQQKVLEQEVLSHQRIQEWARWEENYCRLNRTVEEAEAFLNDGGSGADEEKLTEWRLEACQQTLVKLGESRAAAGLFLDQLRGLQVEPDFAATVAPLGGALELRWQSVCKQTEQEMRRCRDRQESMSRSHTLVSSVTNWLVDANKLLKTWADRLNVSDVSQECVQNHLIKLLDFSMETEAVAVEIASLRAADWPGVPLAELEVGWGQVTSALSHLQERLLAWPSAKLLSDLQLWFQGLERRLSHEKETIARAKNAAQLAGALQTYQGLKVAVANAQVRLEFLCQSGPQLVGEDAAALCSQRTIFAEKAGDLRLHCQLLLTDLGTQAPVLSRQMDEAEQIRGKWAKREERLRRLRSWTEEQKHWLSQRNWPVSQTQAQQSLLELEEMVVRASEVRATVQALDVTLGQTQHHPSELSFSAQAEAVCHACEDLSEVDVLRSAFQQAVELWSHFGRDLREASLLTTRLQCSLRNQPLFSLRQTQEHLDFLQLLEEESRKVGELWASVGTSYERLEHTVDCGTAQLLQGQLEEELKRWRDVVQELSVQHTQTEETLSLWKEYQHLSHQCSLLLPKLRHQWEDLCRPLPELDSRGAVHALQELQEAAEGLQRVTGDVRTASEPLIGRLEAVAANLVKLELQHLSWDVLLLGKTTSRKTERLKFVSELSAAFANVTHRSTQVLLCSVAMERAHLLGRQWAENMIHMSERNGVLQAELLHPQTFPQKRQHLESVQKRLQGELNSLKSQHCAGFQDMLTVLQSLQAQIMVGQQHLQALLCLAVHSSEEATEEEKSELVAQAVGVKRSWFTSVTEVVQFRSVIEQQLSQWSVYRGGLLLIQDLLGDIDCVLPPVGPLSVFKLSSSPDDYQCLLDALAGHSAVYSQTLEAGRQFYQTATDSEHQTRMQTELQDLETAWDKTQAGLERRRELVDTGIQKWSQCQDTIVSLMSEIETLETALKQPGLSPDCEEEKHLQESELALQRLASGLGELTTMKSDLAQYVAAGDSALLEQQLEQLHSQWEELCTKVSLRRQEIADRLSAWTIFNDKNKEFCEWLTQMEKKVCHRGDPSIEEMVEKLKKDCMEEINLFSENKSHLKQLGEQLLLASDAAKRVQVHGSLLEVSQRWHNLFHHVEARVKKLKETLAMVQQLDKNMSNLRWWLSGVEAALSRPITYSICHHQEIQRRLAEQQELQRDIQQHTEGVESVLGLCHVLLHDEDAAGSAELEGDSVEETSRSLDQRWRTICALALDRRLRIEETWRLWCKFLEDYSRFEDWLKTAECTAANPNSADVLYTVAKEELKKFEGLQRQVHERLTHLELVNNQYRRLARENRTDRASQLKAMVHKGNRRWDTLHSRVAAIVRRLKYFTSQREEFEGTRDSMLVWLTELDLQLTNVEHFSESDIRHKIQQLNSFRKEITLNTERIDGLIVFGEGLIQKSSPQDAALIEDQLEELHTYCQEVFSRLVRFHQRLSQPPLAVAEPELPSTAFSLETSLKLICCPRLGRSFGSLPATPTHLLASPLEHSGRETPLSVDSLPLEWDHTGDVGGSSSHEEEEEEDEEEDEEEERAYFSALSASSTSITMHNPPTLQPQRKDSEECTENSPTLSSTPRKQDSLGPMCERSNINFEDVQRYSLVLNGEQPVQMGAAGLTCPDQSGVMGCRELLQAQSDSQAPLRLECDLDDITSWLQSTVPTLERMQQTERAVGVDNLRAEAKDLKEMQKMFARHQPLVLRVNRLTEEAPELQGRLGAVNRAWSRACAFLHQWDARLRKTLANCQEFHESLHSLLLWLDHAERRCQAASISEPDTSLSALQEHRNTLRELREELQQRQAQQTSLQLLWFQLQPEEAPQDSRETQEKVRVTGNKLKLLLKQVDDDLGALQQHLDRTPSSGQGTRADASPEVTELRRVFSRRRKSEPSPPHSLLYRLFRAALPLYLLLLLLLLLPCLIPMSVSNPGCAGTNNFARSFHPMLRYTNGPPPT